MTAVQLRVNVNNSERFLKYLDGKSSMWLRNVWIKSATRITDAVAVV